MPEIKNTPAVRMGVVAVSRDCFPIELSRRRRDAVLAQCDELGLEVVPCSVIIEREADAVKAVAEMREKRVSAVCVYLGNFGPEGPTTIFAKELGVPFMLAGAAEEKADALVDGRGDAFCGMLNACYNSRLRHLMTYVPPMPVGLAYEVAEMIANFADVARVIVGLRGLKVFAFGPRPQDFYACNAPIKQLYDVGVEVMESSELDLFELYRSAAGKKSEIEAVEKEMAAELGEGNKRPVKLRQLAQYEVALTDFFEENLGSRRFGVFANKCWPSFERAFGFVPCYVNARLASRGIPVACEVDIYGAVSEYMAQLASGHSVTLLDVNNTVPHDMEIEDMKGYDRRDLFMGFHCGNTARENLCEGACMKHQRIMHRLMEPGKEPDITAGTLEGTLRPGPATIFRLQGALDGTLRSYVAEGHVLDVDPRSFGSIGVMAIPGMARFYRYVLLEKQFPHHTAVAFRHAGRVLFDAVRMLGVDDVRAPLPAGERYPGENPFA